MPKAKKGMDDLLKKFKKYGVCEYTINLYQKNKELIFNHSYSEDVRAIIEKFEKIPPQKLRLDKTLKDFFAC